MIKKLLNWWLRPFVIRDKDGSPYMTRYFVFRVRWCKWFAIYLHNIHRDDRDDMHDHPWNFTTFILRGGYWEYLTDHPPLTDRRRWCKPGSVLRHQAEDVHRVALRRNDIGEPIPAWTLVVIGRKRRSWGFHTLGGWVHWRTYCDEKFGQGNYEPVKDME